MTRFKPVTTTFGDLILRRRTHLGLSFDKLEEITGISGTYICQLQNHKAGDRKVFNPSFWVVRRLKNALDLTWEEIDACTEWSVMDENDGPDQPRRRGIVSHLKANR